MLAAAAEQMTASISEISRSSVEAAGGAAAVTAAQDAAVTIDKLAVSSAEIGTVLKAIMVIAEQTNLLALNATIEAARGKDLAQETAKATGNVTERITAIQADAHAAITSIGDAIEKINQHQSTIAIAVEEQNVTTTSMTRT